MGAAASLAGLLVALTASTLILWAGHSPSRLLRTAEPPPPTRRGHIRHRGPRRHADSPGVGTGAGPAAAPPMPGGTDPGTGAGVAAAADGSTGSAPAPDAGAHAASARPPDPAPAANATPAVPLPPSARAQLHPLSVLQPPPPAPGLHVAVLSGGQPPLFKRYAYHLASKPCYARVQGYSFLLDATTVVPAAEAAGLPPQWVKVHMLRRWLPHYDWLFWTDLDATIFAPQTRVESFLALQHSAHLLVPQDSMQRLVFSNDAFLLKNSPWGRRFLDRWWEYRRLCPNTHADQGAMWLAIADLMAPPGNASACAADCRDKARREALYACLDAQFRARAHPGGPVLFVPVDFGRGVAGLCLNGYQNDHTRYPALQRRMPFCLHSKHPAKWAGPQLRKRVRWDKFQCPK